MQAYLIKRLLSTIPTLFGITLITFMLIRLAPGDPVSSRFDLSGGGPGMDGGGSQDADRLQDSARAKKMLLGMVRHDTTAHRWSPVPIGDDIVPLDEPDQIGEFEGWLRAAAVSPDGQTLWIGGRDNVVTAHAITGDAIAEDPSVRLEGHAGAIRSIALSPDGAHLASSDDAGAIRIWSLASKSTIGEVAGDGTPVAELLFATDDTVLAARQSGAIVAHGLDGAEKRTYAGHIGAVYALARDEGGFWSGGIDRKLRRWALDGDAPLLTDDRHGQAITDIAIGPDGEIATACDDRKIRLFARTADGLAEPRILEGHHKGVAAVAHGADGTLWSGGRDETVRSWDRAAGKQIAESPYNPGHIHRVVPVGAGVVTVGDTWIEVPLVTQYLSWLGRTVRFDFGRSFTDDEPVLRHIARALPVTLGLNAIAIFIIYLVSIPLGILAAVKRAKLFDTISSIVLFLLYSIPNFWLATLLIMFLSSERNLNILPSSGLASPDEWQMSYFPWLWDRFLHLVLPITVMVYAGFASLSRYVRTSMLEALSQDYVRTARAKGLRERVVVLKHAFRNALVTIVTLVGNLLPQLFGGSLIIEVIFSINGMGKLAFDSILSRDYPVIMAITTFAAVLTLLGILISDLLYGVVDPRVKVDK